MSEERPGTDRRQPVVPALHQPVRPATLRASIGAREVVEDGQVVSLNDRTVVVEVRDPTVALALSLAAHVELAVDLGGGTQTLSARPGDRVSDNPTSRRVELVLSERQGGGP